MTDKPAKVHVSEVLTPLERKYCAIRARGFNKAESYRQAANKPRLKAEDASSRACEIERRPRVITKLRALLDSANKADIVTHGRYVQSLIDDAQEARDAANYTALAAFQRLIGQSVGALSDIVDVRQVSDSNVLIQKLEGILDDKALQALRDQFNAKDTFH
ncbi:MAG TPA: hypothetical protein VLA24_16480 [Pseudomonadales bacterium]|nr:hypothetical protein [Pseudomonadales bacterium]